MDPWGIGNKSENNEIQQSFDNDFAIVDKRINGMETVLKDQYSMKLEDKLKRIQSKNEKCNSSKDMLKSLKTQRESFMNNLMSSNQIEYTSNNMSISENPTFFENLYQTNSFYRHMNPQQPLESSEKLPIVHHDQLAHTSTDNGAVAESKMYING